MLLEPRRVSPAAVDPPAVQVFALGGFRVVAHGYTLQDHDWRRKTARQLFKVLLSRPTRRMTRDEVVDLLWPDSDPQAASSNLRSTIHAMRHALDPANADQATGIGIVSGDRDSVWLHPDVELWLDADTFEDTIKEAWRSADPLPLLEQASALYTGHYLPDDLFEDWATERREALKQYWAELQIRLAHELERRGDPDAAAHAIQRLLQVDPCDERAAQEAMQLLTRHGRRAEALRIYQRLLQALMDELGVEPANETQALNRHIAAGDVAEPPVGATFRCAYPFPEPSTLVGRDAELGVLGRVLASGRTAGHAVLIGAPAGTGKSALAGQLVKKAQAQGVLCLAGGCYEERGAVPLGPFHDALVDFLLAQPAERIRADLASSVGDLAQVIPELRYHLKLADAVSSGWPTVDRTRAFGAIHACLRSLAERGPALVCLEDLHAADEATLQLLHYLVRQTRRLPLVLLATYRTDEAPADQPLAQTLAAMARERLIQQVPLSSLGRTETDRLLTLLLDGSPSEALSESLYEASGGNPLFVEQLVLALSETGQLQQRAGVWHGTTELQGTPQIVREVIAQRLSRLAPRCRETLAMAAVLGQAFEHKVLLAAVDPVDEPTLLKDLDRAIGALVLQETPGGYAFRHSLLREAVYWDLSAPRRMLLHAHAGKLLERFRGERAGDYAAELAHHFMLAGESTPVHAKALHYCLLAGKRAAELSSYPESLTHYNRAWDIIEREGSLADLDVRLESLSGRGWAEANMARYPESVASCRQVLALSSDPIQRGRARKVIGYSLDHTGAFRELIGECEAGLAEVADVTGPQAVEIRATLLQLIGLVWYRQGRFGEVLSLGRRIEREATHGAPGPRMLAHKVLGWGYAGQGQMERAIQQYELAIAEAEQWGDKPSLATSYGILGQLDYLSGRFADAREHLARSLSLYRESANELRAAFPLNTLCQVWVAEGEHVRASEQILGALELELEGHDRFAADAHHVLGVIHVLRTEWETATTSFEQALAIVTRAEDIAGTVEATVALGFVDQCVGRWREASTRYVDAVKISRAMDPSPQRVLALRCLGRLHLLAGYRVPAASEIGEALALAETMSETLEYAPALLAMAQLRASEGQISQALTLATRSLDQTRPLEQLVEVHVVLSQIHQAMGDTDGAGAHADEANAQAGRLGSPRLLSLANLVAAQALAVQDPESASAAFHVALHQADQARTPYERATVLRAYSGFLRQTGMRLDQATWMEAEALRIAQGLRLPQSDPVHDLLPATT